MESTISSVLYVMQGFYEMRENEQAYIDRSYGWAYMKIDKFNFKEVCALVNPQAYEDFKMMSDYSHGTGIYSKMPGGIGVEAIMNMISCIYLYIQKLVMIYCRECIDDTFYEADIKLNSSICDALGIDV